MLQDLMALQDHPSENNEGWEWGKADSEKMGRYCWVNKKQKKLPVMPSVEQSHHDQWQSKKEKYIRDIFSQDNTIENWTL